MPFVGQVPIDFQVMCFNIIGGAQVNNNLTSYRMYNIRTSNSVTPLNSC